MFLRDVLGLNSVSGPYKVRREFPTAEKRRVDLVVEAPGHIVGIELKIDAHDQARQLYDYHQELEQQAGGQKSVTLVYLTLDGKRASKGSIGTLDESSIVRVSFAEDVMRWLQRCVDISADKPLLVGGLQQYQQLVKDLTGQGGSVTDRIANELKGDQERLECALAVERALPKAKAAIQRRFWEELHQALSEKVGSPVTVYGGSDLRSIARDYYEKGRNNKHVGMKVPVGQFGDKNVCLYTNLYHAVHYGLRVEDASGNALSAVDDRSYFRSGPEGKAEGNAVADDHSSWLICFYFNPASGDESRIINFYDFNEAARSLMDDEARHELIENMVAHQLELVSKAKRVFDLAAA